MVGMHKRKEVKKALNDMVGGRMLKAIPTDSGLWPHSPNKPAIRCLPPLRKTANSSFT